MTPLWLLAGLVVFLGRYGWYGSEPALRKRIHREVERQHRREDERLRRLLDRGKS